MNRKMIAILSILSCLIMLPIIHVNADVQTSAFQAQISNVNNAAGTYDVIVTPTANVTRVKIPVFTAKNGQDDLVWHEGVKQSNGQYTYTVKSTDHKYESGEYKTQIYATVDGKEIYADLGSTTLTPQPKVTITSDAKNIYAKYSNTQPYKITPLLYAWSDKNKPKTGQADQRDLVHYQGNEITVPVAVHSGYGKYMLWSYYYNSDNQPVQISNDVIETKDKSVNIVDESKWFPFNQELQLYKTTDTSKNKIEVINKSTNTKIGTSIHNGMPANLISWTSQADIPNNLIIKATYYNAGKYQGRDIDAVVTHKNFVSRPNWGVTNGLLGGYYVKITKDLFNGFYISGFWYSEADIEFYEAGTTNIIDMKGDSFISTNSINAGEYTTYLNSSDNSNIFFPTDNNLIRGNPKDLGYPNKWGIWENDKTLLYGDMQASIGISSNFTDRTDGETFQRNSAAYRLLGTTHRFIIGTPYSQIWSTFSSAMFNVKPSNPIKTIHYSDGTDATGQELRQGQEVIYDTSQTVGNLGVTLINKYAKFQIADKLDTHLRFGRAELLINNVASTTGSKLITYNNETNEVQFKADSAFIDSMKFNNETYTLRIYAKGYGTPDDVEPTINNTSITTINNESMTSNTLGNKVIETGLNVSADEITINTGTVNDKYLNANIKLSQTAKNPSILNYAQYRMLIDETDNTGKSIRQVYSQDINASELQSDMQVKLPFSTLNKSTKVYYLIRFENLSTDVDFTSNTLLSYGVTASERVINTPTKKVTDVVQTYKTSKDVDTQERNETYEFKYLNNVKLKSGYSTPVDFQIDYSTDALNLNPNDNYNISIETNKSLLDKDSTVPYTAVGDKSRVKLEKTNPTLYQFQNVYSESKTGKIVTNDQRDQSNEYKDAGRKLYIPIWTNLNQYQVKYVSEIPLGINHYVLDVSTNIDVYAQMQATYDSKSIKFDELNLSPVLPDNFEKSGEWSDTDTKWVKQPLNNDWNGTKYTLTDGNWVKK